MYKIKTEITSKIIWGVLFYGAVIWSICKIEQPLELLNYPNECKIDQVNKNGNTALILGRNQ